ncbi:MAG: phage adsorption protein NrfB [Lachnospiraceae bacterium]|nr:phage adsorption protein NrfB [Lachnospiraceae bacterium]
MNWSEIVKVAGAILISIYLFFGIDDVIWYLYSTISKFFKKKDEDEVLDFVKLRMCPPKMLAVSIAAWHESNVIGDVLENFLNTTDYPKSMYHIFVGVYPNDPETIEVVNNISKEFPNVHAIVNDKEGPTTKAQNINCVIRQIKKFENELSVQFASLTIHDSEDVIHPYELLTTNYLIDKHAALQFPVFPIVKMPKISNFFKQLTTATYADEFAENHYMALVERRTVGAFVPCAGTGFALSKRLIESYNGEDVLPSNALTEDYLLSLTLYKKGMTLYYVLNKLPRVLQSGKIKTDFITTRSLFPNTFKAAVKQKTRWTYGITMQSISVKDIFSKEKISFAGRYSFYKDAKTKLVNLVPFFGYIASVYCIVAIFLDITPLYEPNTPVYYMAMAVFTMMILHQIFRGYALYKVYGFRSVIFGCLFPPLFPIRLIYGNIINFVATFRAFNMKYISTKKTIKNEAEKEMKEKIVEEKPKEVKWAKTDHEFLSKQQLRGYRRMLGDVLITQGLITPKEFKTALKKVDKENGEQIGSYLIKQGTITNEEFMDVLGHVKHIQFIPTHVAKRLNSYDCFSKFDIDDLRKKLILPLAYEKGKYVLGVCDKTTDENLRVFAEENDIVYKRMFLTESDITNIIDEYKKSNKHYKPLESVGKFENGQITYEQAVLIGIYSHILGKEEKMICEQMGLCWNNKKVAFV